MADYKPLDLTGGEQVRVHAQRRHGSRRRPARCSSTPPTPTASRSRSSVTSRGSATRSAPAGCASSRSRACAASRPPARPRSRRTWSSTPSPRRSPTPRTAILEFILVNHPLDCPVCDKGGECPLQDRTFRLRPGTSRFTEMKRHFPKPLELSSQIALDRERCIICYRCVRFSQDVAEDGALIVPGARRPESDRDLHRRRLSTAASRATSSTSARSARSRASRTASSPGRGISQNAPSVCTRLPGRLQHRADRARGRDPARHRAHPTPTGKSRRAGSATRGAGRSRSTAGPNG